MILEDKIYGRFDVQEPVLIDLLKSPTVQRLKGISQRGYPDFVDDHPVNYTRYEHSVGCMLLLRKLNASLEEQIAGLLHDVSHAAFSHVIDWVLGDPSKQDYQDSILKDYISKSEIPSILTKHGLDAKKMGEIEEMDHFGLLERKSPQLCVDRLDYSLRDMDYNFHENVSVFIDDLTVSNGHIVFRHFENALRYGRLYSKCQDEIWGEVRNMVRYHLISKFLRSALDQNIISYPDLYRTEEELLKVINEKGNEKLKRQEELAFGEFKFEILKGEGLELRRKFRYVDPEVMHGSQMTTLSSLDPAYKEFIEAQKSIYKQRVSIRIYDD